MAMNNTGQRPFKVLFPRDLPSRQDLDDWATIEFVKPPGVEELDFVREQISQLSILSSESYKIEMRESLEDRPQRSRLTIRSVVEEIGSGRRGGQSSLLARVVLLNILHFFSLEHQSIDCVTFRSELWAKESHFLDTDLAHLPFDSIIEPNGPNFCLTVYFVSDLPDKESERLVYRAIESWIAIANVGGFFGFDYDPELFTPLTVEHGLSMTSRSLQVSIKRSCIDQIGYDILQNFFVRVHDNLARIEYVELA